MKEKKKHLAKYFVIPEISNTVRNDLNYLLAVTLAENKLYRKITFCRKDNKSLHQNSIKLHIFNASKRVVSRQLQSNVDYNEPCNYMKSIKIII